MLNSDGIENNNKKTALTTAGLTRKENNFAHAAHFFFWTFLYLYCCTTIMWSFLVYTLLWRKCFMFSQKINCCLCSCSLSFALPLIFILLAANIPHFLTTAMKFSCVSKKICLLCFYLSLLFFPCYPCQPRH